jgi:hypothetical protein
LKVNPLRIFYTVEISWNSRLNHEMVAYYLTTESFLSEFERIIYVIGALMDIRSSEDIVYFRSPADDPISN